MQPVRFKNNRTPNREGKLVTNVLAPYTIHVLVIRELDVEMRRAAASRNSKNYGARSDLHISPPYSPEAGQASYLYSPSYPGLRIVGQWASQYCGKETR
jgi:hypothetical protein